MCVCLCVCVLHINPKWTMNVKRNKLEMTINEQVSLALRDHGVTCVCITVCVKGSMCVWNEADFW